MKLDILTLNNENVTDNFEEILAEQLIMTGVECQDSNTFLISPSEAARRNVNIIQEINHNPSQSCRSGSCINTQQHSCNAVAALLACQAVSSLLSRKLS